MQQACIHPRMPSRSDLHPEYLARFNRVLDYIDRNLDQNLSLDELAGVASFSKFHFSRLFQACAGEPPYQFILRIRLEKAATLLCTEAGTAVGDIASRCGFSDPAIFSRNFKTQFGHSPSAYRKMKDSKNHQKEGKKHQMEAETSAYFCFSTNQIKWRTNMELNKSVEVKDLPAMTVAYVRHIGPYAGDEKLFEGLWNRLFGWAGPRGLIGGPDFKSLVIYHDDPNVTAADKLRMSVCITVPKDTKTEGEIGKMEIEAARYMIACFVVDATQFAQAWEWVYGQWLPTSGYQPDDKPCFEMYPEEPKDGKFTVDICVPVKPL